MKIFAPRGAFTLIELMVTTAIIGVVGLVLFSLLNINMILGAKNTAINTTHEQARVASLDMLQDLHSSISVPALTDATGTVYSSPPVSGYAEGISFQKWASGPYAIRSDATTSQNVIHVALLSTQTIPTYYGANTQKLIIPTLQIEDFITAIGGTNTDLSITLANNIKLPIKGTGSTGGHIVCFITDCCSYTVSNNTLQRSYRGNSYTVSSKLMNATPFYLPSAITGGAFALSNSDVKYNNRGYKSANVLLNGQVAIKAQLTTSQ